jgi:hypothetical protein
LSILLQYKANSRSVNAIRIQKMMQAMGVPPTGQVAIAVAQRGVLQNPGGATGNLGGAATQRRGLSRGEFRRQIQQGQQQGTPTNGNNPVAAQLLLAPTFTPVQANAVLDQANMRIAVPIRQIDGEYILTMQVMGGAQPAQAAQPAQPAQPAAGEGQTPTAAEPATQSSLTPAAEAPASSASAAEGEKKKPTMEGSTANSTESAKPERRQENKDSGKDKYGLDKAPQGAVIMTMKEIDTMVNAVTWGGQVAITKMMSEYVKEQTGKDMAPINNGTETAEAGTKIVV